MSTQCSSCGAETHLGYENRSIALENAGVIKLIGVPLRICSNCSAKYYDKEVENRIEKLLGDLHCPEDEKILFWSGNSFTEVDPKRFQLPDYPDRYIKRPKRKVEI